MSIHPSLTLSDKDRKLRSVLKRTERLRKMIEKGQWKEGDEVYGLPKIKTVRIKIKKEKAEKVEEAAPVIEGEAVGTPPKGEPKEQPATKSTASKGQAKSPPSKP